jgi:metal-responsive CopG/Arc/MetJ family transcriptional regulator
VDKEKFTIELDKNEIEKVDRLCTQWHLSRTDAIRKMIDFYLMTNYKYSIKYGGVLVNAD